MEIEKETYSKHNPRLFLFMFSHHENERVKYHYYQSGPSPSECSYYRVNEATPRGGHRFMTEKAIFARWAQSYNLTFHYPGWSRSLQEAAKKIDTPFAKIFHLKGRG